MRQMGFISNESLAEQSLVFYFLKVIESDQDVPTLLHFAARHGLEDLTCAIMDTPGSSSAFQIENKDGLDPSDLAELNGFVDLAEHMRTQFVSKKMGRMDTYNYILFNNQRWGSLLKKKL